MTTAQMVRTIHRGMKKYGIKQSELAEALGVSKSHLSMTLNGHRAPSKDFEQRVRAAVRRILRARCDAATAYEDAMRR